MNYLLTRNGRYYYHRRVPDELRDLDPRLAIRISVKTDCRATAKRRVADLNQKTEQYWNTLLQEHQVHNDAEFRNLTKIARQQGFNYLNIDAVAALPILELINRALAIETPSKTVVEAVLGSPKEASLTIEDALEKYWTFTKDRIVKKTEDQIRKWRNPRLKAIKNLVSLVGNKDVLKLTRDDILVLKDHWSTRIQKENKCRSSANKDLIHVKDVFAAVNDNMRLGIDIGGLFNKVLFKQRKKRKRPPFNRDQTLKIVTFEGLKELPLQAKCALWIVAELGVRPTEVAGLLPCDINLDAEIPFLDIRDHSDKELKTSQSERKIPLVGYALDAIKQCPEGFHDYREQPDQLSNLINPFLRQNGLLPTEKHTFYSLRHGFQDRLTAVDAPDRVQADLMGHEFNRTEYGDGATIEKKLEWLNRIKLMG